MRELFREIFKYRELLWQLALKELRVRYKRSVLGFLWALLNPLLMMIVLTIVFSTVMRAGIKDYAVFLVSTLLPWTFFSQALSYGSESILSNSDLLKKVYIPKSLFPIAAVMSNAINFLLSMIPMVFLLIALRFPVHWTWIFLPIPLVALVLFTLGFAFFLAAANVFFRDMSHILQIVLSAWFYFSPVIYSLEFISPSYRYLFKLNPMLYLLENFRSIIYFGKMPSMTSMAISFACGIGFCVLGYMFFRHHQDKLVFYV